MGLWSPAEKISVIVFVVVDELYPTSESKVALVCAVGQSAKRHLVSEFGIGEELQMNLFGWRGSHLAVIGQIDSNWGDMDDEEDRVDRLSFAARSMRRGWGVDAFTLLSEAYVSQKPRETRGKELSSEFADGNGDVEECLSIIHIESEGEEIHVCAQRFDVEVGKNVVFGDMLHSEDRSVVRNDGYTQALAEMLSLSAIKSAEDWQRVRLELAMMTADEAGWYIQYDL